MGQFFNAKTAPTGGSLYREGKSRVPIGHCYVPHEGHAAKRRRLRQRTRGLTPTIEQDFRINVWLKSEPHLQRPGVDLAHCRMVLLNMALCHSETTIVSFEDALDVVLDKLEREMAQTLTAAAVAPEARV